MTMKSHQEIYLCVNTFCGRSPCHDECGTNGLPLTPSSVKILGRFQYLKTLQNTHLCHYVDIQRSKQERLVVVSEYYRNCLKEKFVSPEEREQYTRKVIFEVLQALAFLNSHGIVHRCLAPENILIDRHEHVKLFNYGLYYMTGHGSDVSFPLGSVKYLPPEVILLDMNNSQAFVPTYEDFGIGPESICPYGFAVDIWSLGIISLELLLGKTLWKEKSPTEVSKIVLDFLSQEENAFDIIISKEKIHDIKEKISLDFQEFIRACLKVDNKRPLAKELLKLNIFDNLTPSKETCRGFTLFSPKLRCADMNIDFINSTEDYLLERDLEEVYHLWQLAGGDLEMVLKKEDILNSSAAISRLGNLVLDSGEIYGENKDISQYWNETVIILSMEQLQQRLKDIQPISYFPLLEDEFQLSNSISASDSTAGEIGSNNKSAPSSGLEFAETSRLPLVIKERDVEYQFHRIVLYERLLKAYPFSKERLWKEARIDIPPLYRQLTWAAILDIEGDVRGRYVAIDKVSPTLTDRQIEVDIPRCHQYNEILSSPQGHMKLKRILKAWVISHPEYVYWQGLDSLCAPFLCLNFNDEAIAFACVDKFISKYLHGFFLKDNSAVIQEYLAVFAHLIAFHDPEVFTHLDEIGFIPDLYAIPWFLTMFAHVFPINKIYHLWDTLLLGNSSFPLFIGVAILLQFREQLMSFGFNECILHFSDMPEIDIGKCVEDSVRLFCATPTSVSYRKHAILPTPVKSSTNNVYKDQLATEPISLQQLKAEKCCRISSLDLLDMMKIGPNVTSSPYKRSKNGKSKVLVIDCRSKEEFMRGALPISTNIPFDSAFSAEGKFNPATCVDIFSTQLLQVKVVISNQEQQAIKFAETILQLGYSKVCVLHKGIDSFKKVDVLIVPPPEL